MRTEILRMVPGLQVAKLDSSKWAITSRGFNGRLSNKLLVLMDGAMQVMDRSGPRQVPGAEISAVLIAPPSVGVGVVLARSPGG